MPALAPRAGIGFTKSPIPWTSVTSDIRGNTTQAHPSRTQLWWSLRPASLPTKSQLEDKSLKGQRARPPRAPRVALLILTRNYSQGCMWVWVWVRVCFRLGMGWDRGKEPLAAKQPIFGPWGLSGPHRHIPARQGLPVP